MPYQVDLRYD